MGRWFIVRVAVGALVGSAALAGDVAAEPPRRPSYLPAAPTESEPSGSRGFELRREAGRGWVYDHHGFRARIAEDGAVRFEDRHGEIFLALPLPLPLPEGTPTLQGELRKLVDRRARDRARPVEPTQVPGPIPKMSPYRPAPSEVCRYPDPCFFRAKVFLVNVAASFDLTDEIMRLAHQDPYRPAKASFLASTAEFRHDLARRAATRARTQALDELRLRLDAIDKSPRPPAERRAALRSLLEDLDPDPAVAAPARAMIEARLQRADARAP